jgi:aspartate racemase
MVRTDRIQGVILGCTELPLILGPEHTDLPLLNTTELHVAAICDCCLQGSAS